MKKFISLTMLSLMLIGCGQDRFILIPPKAEHPTFETKDFQYSKTFKFTGWEESDDNGTYIVTEKDHGIAFIGSAKTDKSNYNLLLRQINNFNTETEKLNAEIRMQKPQEVDSYNFD